MDISIILAAGEGTRMKSKKSKVLHRISNKPILEYVIDASTGANVDKNIVVVGKNKEEVEEYFETRDISLRQQPFGEDQPYGTGFAVMQAMDLVNDNDRVLILYGDTPLIRKETILELIDYHSRENLDATVLTAEIEEPTGYGRIVREADGSVLKIVEEKDAEESERSIKEINSGIYMFNGKLLKEALNKIDNNNAQNEYYVTDVIGILKEDGHRVGAYRMKDSEEIHGVNSRVQLAFCQKVINRRINLSHMEAGVTIIDPENTYIDSKVKIGQDTIIYPGVILEGETEIGNDCIIRQNTRIYNSKIASNVCIESSVIEDSQVDSGTVIGPYAHLRPKSNIGKNVKLGNFVEVKNSNLGEGTKASHLAYIGDADIGSNVNIGCGVVFVNYDGKNKFRSLIGDNAFIGSNANIISPIEVKDRGFIAAGSTITDSVDERELAIARAKQVGKKLWVKDI